MLDLYISETCPYCQKVMEFFEKNNINFTKKDVAEPENLSSLLKLGGKAQIPFLKCFIMRQITMNTMIVSQWEHAQFLQIFLLCKKL